MRRSAGNSIALVLMVAALAMLAAFVAANVVTINLRMSSRLANLSIAENLAESVVQEALGRLQDDLAFSEDLHLEGKEQGLPPGSRGFLTFARTSGGPFSTNNFVGGNNLGWQRTVPDKMVHLVGVGECNGVTRRVEIVAQMPEFPVAAASDGPVRAKACLIGGFPTDNERQWIPGQGFAVEKDDLTPGHLISNAVRQDSIVLDSRTRVTGDVQSRGEVMLNGALVEGEVRSSWGKNAPLPKFDLEKFDPANSVDIFFKELSSPNDTLALVGNVRYSGNLSVRNSLTLDNSFLFVDGNLTVEGPLSGRGALVATGVVKLQGSANLVSGQQIAILAKNGIEVSGLDSGRSVFQGLLYSQGYFRARDITILGGFVVEGGGLTELEDIDLYYSATQVSPDHKREVYAVVPRFVIPPTEGNLLRDETGFAYGTWKQRGRNVVNVLDIGRADWRRSDWELDDPAVISIRWVNGQAVYRYDYFGKADGSGNRDDSIHAFHEDTDAANFARGIAAQNTAPNVHEHLNGSPPNPAAYEQYLLQVIDHLSRPVQGRSETNFALDPNEFIGEGERIRIAFRRVF